MHSNFYFYKSQNRVKIIYCAVLTSLFGQNSEAFKKVFVGEELFSNLRSLSHISNVARPSLTTLHASDQSATGWLDTTLHTSHQSVSGRDATSGIPLPYTLTPLIYHWVACHQHLQLVAAVGPPICSSWQWQHWRNASGVVIGGPPASQYRLASRGATFLPFPSPDLCIEYLLCHLQWDK